jgi:superfamily II DNA or RNA helicase|tara:strand:- start:5036 stop:6532 length:1497 start_codon:yes stop_codon:yes gene_type:complete
MLTAYKKDETKVLLRSDDSGILMELSEYFTFFAEGYKFMPAYRNKLWDGKIRLYDSRSQTIPYGLMKRVAEFCYERGYKLVYDEALKNHSFYERADLEKFIEESPISLKDKLIKPRDYQLDAFVHGVQNKRAILISPTGSGKSLIIYMMMRHYLSHEMDKKVLVVVPTTSLVEQMYKDFESYSWQDSSFDVEEDVHRIYSGKEKINFDAAVVVTTWQSAIKLPQSWFTHYGMVIGDEAHTFKAKSLTTIMNRLVNAHFRIGTTGTIDDAVSNKMTLEGNFGPVYKVTTTKELMDADTLAQLRIQCLVLKYRDEERKACKGLKYQDEIDIIVSHEKRNRFIVNLTADQQGNSLVLYNLVGKHGKPLYNAFVEKLKGTGRKVFFVSGAVNAEEREKIREVTEQEKNAVIVASVGTFSTGINIVNLHNIVFASPTKSQIRVLQSIGRGLRKTENGQGTTIYDLADDLSWKSKKNYTLNHAIERVKIYAKEKFKYEMHEVPL